MGDEISLTRLPADVAYKLDPQVCSSKGGDLGGESPTHATQATDAMSGVDEARKVNKKAVGDFVGPVSSDSWETSAGAPSLLRSTA